MSPNGGVALVVGGAGGIGAAVSQRLARNQFSVCVADLDFARAQVVIDDLHDVSDGSMAIECDVRSSDSVDATVANVAEAYGHLDVLVVCSGDSDPSRIEETSDEAWSEIVDVHLGGTMRCARAAIPLLSQSAKPSIVTTSSPASRVGAPGRASYAAAKSGVEGLTRVLSVELAPLGIRVNAISPGFTATPLLIRLAESGEVDLDRLKTLVPLGLLATPNDIAGVVAFLVSSEARYLTGQTIVVDGGFLIDGVRGSDR